MSHAYEIAPYLFCSVLALAMFVFVFFPVQQREEITEKTRLAYLHERKDVIYENLRDLNFEYKSGKFSPADFEAMRGSMEAEAARILAEIETLEAAKA